MQPDFRSGRTEEEPERIGLHGRAVAVVSARLVRGAIMKFRVAFAFALVGLWTSRIFAQTPTPTPVPAVTPTPRLLQITFTGLLVFHKTSQGTEPLQFTVNVPNFTHHAHEAYIEFGKDDLKTSSGFEAPLSCPKGCDFKYVHWTGQKLEIDNQYIELENLSQSGDLLLSPLGRLARRADPKAEFSPNCDSSPAPGPDVMAGCMPLRYGTLSHIPGLNSAEWAFKTKYGWKDSKVQQCVAGAILLTLKLKAGKDEVRLFSSSPAAELVLKVPGDAVTVRVANSLNSDICCPSSTTPADKDEHFTNYYELIQAQKKVEYLPHRTKRTCTDAKTLSRYVEIPDSLRGSDCLGSQWP
jgi:hypothetical protein